MNFRIYQSEFLYAEYETRYTQISKEEVTCFYTGLLVYGDCQTVEKSIHHLIDDFRSNSINYSELLGSYRVILFDSVKNEVIFFTDNAGTLCFFYDSKSPHIVSDTLFPLLKERIGNKPNYNWIVQFLQFGCSYSLDTAVTDVKRTSPNNVYRLNGTGISAFSKQLPDFSMPHGYQSLQGVLKKLIRACEQQKIVSVITGGTDSRAVLANLLSLGISPELAITGCSQDIDVQIAHEIAALLKQPLHFFEDIPQEPDWIENSFLAADAMYGVLGRYRLYSKSQHLQKLGFSIEFGGGAGELYKNSFINQDFPCYHGHPNWKRFYQYKIAAFDISQKFIGPALQTPLKTVRNTVMQSLVTQEGKNKFQTYNSVGYSIMQHRMITLSNSSSQWVTSPALLMERPAAALVHNVNPYTLEMQRFQRNEIHIHAPRLANVRTDRGLTCSAVEKDIRKEVLKSFSVLIKVGLTRTFKRKTVFSRIDACFTQGLASEEFRRSVHVCKKLSLLPDEVLPEELPKGLADRFMMLGMLFDRI